MKTYCFTGFTDTMEAESKGLKRWLYESFHHTNGEFPKLGYDGMALPQNNDTTISRINLRFALRLGIISLQDAILQK